MASLFDTNQAVRIAKYFLEDIEDPVNLVPVSLVVLCLAVAGRPRGLAWWAMFNGCIIHCWMDGIVGMFGRGPKWLVIEYGKLDSRYWPTKDSLVMMICAVELLIMGPLCLLWYHAIIMDKWYKHFLAIITSTFQMMGCILYFSAELYDGCEHIPFTTWPPTFTKFDDLFYFWFIYVFANGVWIIIPSYVMITTLQEMYPIYIHSSQPKKSKKRN
ncbi:3-beta-hydroxysteroid-Delta(8),Delta(7)-isomerase isoform X2 [Nematostella vectensis]|uniref:3-beta-hydroxysteroid-Delta(8), Delta(7)-isomerase isoform X2 n=1 Tax=Nematostella vectensis TaxID=45351 RepID=UPI002077930C|nr:3-beta-hydroxysteroid-Delta(8),Delta(7)-isomerase isoform X2 [Nematostella vectensis]